MAPRGKKSIGLRVAGLALLALCCSTMLALDVAHVENLLEEVPSSQLDVVSMPPPREIPGAEEDRRRAAAIDEYNDDASNILELVSASVDAPKVARSGTMELDVLGMDDNAEEEEEEEDFSGNSKEDELSPDERSLVYAAARPITTSHSARTHKHVSMSMADPKEDPRDALSADDRALVASASDHNYDKGDMPSTSATPHTTVAVSSSSRSQKSTQDDLSESERELVRAAGRTTTPAAKPAKPTPAAAKQRRTQDSLDDEERELVKDANDTPTMPKMVKKNKKDGLTPDERTLVREAGGDDKPKAKVVQKKKKKSLTVKSALASAKTGKKAAAKTAAKITPPVAAPVKLKKEALHKKPKLTAVQRAVAKAKAEQKQKDTIALKHMLAQKAKRARKRKAGMKAAEEAVAKQPVKPTPKKAAAPGLVIKKTPFSLVKTPPPSKKHKSTGSDELTPAEKALIDAVETPNNKKKAMAKKVVPKKNTPLKQLEKAKKETLATLSEKKAAPAETLVARRNPKKAPVNFAKSMEKITKAATKAALRTQTAKSMHEAAKDVARETSQANLKKAHAALDASATAERLAMESGGVSDEAIRAHKNKVATKKMSLAAIERAQKKKVSSLALHSFKSKKVDAFAALKAKADQEAAQDAYTAPRKRKVLDLDALHKEQAREAALMKAGSAMSSIPAH
jgi:hypothetical protein